MNESKRICIFRKRKAAKNLPKKGSSQENQKPEILDRILSDGLQKAEKEQELTGAHRNQI